jgi:hypothetical protein
VQYLTIMQAAERLGRDQSTVYSMVRAGRMQNVNKDRTGVALVAAADVHRVAFELRHAALQKTTELDLARTIKNILWPDDTVVVRADGTPDADSMTRALNRVKGRDALRFLPPEAYSVFGPSVINAAASKFPNGSCRTCWARLTASVHEDHSPRNEPAYRELLGHPCAEDVTAWAKQKRDARRELDEIKAHVTAAAAADRQARFRTEYEAAAKDLQRAQGRFNAVQASAAPRTRTAAATPKPYPLKGCGHPRGIPCSCRADAAHTCGVGSTVCINCEASR